MERWGGEEVGRVGRWGGEVDKERENVVRVKLGKEMEGWPGEGDVKVLVNLWCVASFPDYEELVFHTWPGNEAQIWIVYGACVNDAIVTSLRSSAIQGHVCLRLLSRAVPICSGAYQTRPRIRLPPAC